MAKNDSNPKGAPVKGGDIITLGHSLEQDLM